MYLTIIVICILFSAYFSATETAFSSLSRITLTNMAKTSKKATKTLRIYEQYDRLITTILIGNNIVNILSASLFSILCVTWFGEDKGPALSTIILTIIILLVGEITPKVIAKQYPEKFAMVSTPLISLFMIILTPISWLFSSWTAFIKMFFKNIITTDDSVEIEDEILTMVEEAASDGKIEDDKKDLIQNAITFYETTVEEIYTPRVDVVAVSKNATMEEIAKTFEESSFSRLPVYEDNLDSIIGFINYKDFDPELSTIDSILQEIICVTTNQKIADVLEQLQESQTHISIVVGEFGEVLGVLTLEDIMEELVGEIYDESDDIEEVYKKLDDNNYVIYGNADMDFVMELIGEQIDSKVHTLNGWLIEQLKRMPKAHDTVTYNQWTLEVVEMKDKMIGQVRVSKTKE